MMMDPRVLVLEDSRSDFELARRELVKAGLRDIEWARDRGSFIEALERAEPSIALLDHSLPDFDGISAMRLLRERFPDVPSIIVSGAIGEEIAIETMRAGATDYVLKDNIERLVPVTRRALHEAEQLRARKEVERELLESRKRYELLFSSINEGISMHELIHDADGVPVDYRTININPAYERMIDKPRGDVIGVTASAMFGRPLHLDRYVKVMETGESVSFEDTEIRPGKVLLISAFPFEPMRFATLAVDITYRKELETQLEERARELARSNEELQQFAYVASHDLQEPLRMVTGYMTLLQKRCDGQLDDQAKEYVRFAAEGAARARDLVKDLLEYSRVGSLQRPMSEANMEHLCDLACINLREQIREEGAAIERGPLPNLVVDEVQMVALLQNLISNAIKFHGPSPPRVDISCREDGGEWVFCVKDNGIGIEPSYQERIFQIFQRLHGVGEYSGTGIGLAICKRIVERHGGRIWVESSPGEGSSFFFTVLKSGRS
jgi:signal transduction histidine kinase/DNA-binding response OmpR family regulator